MIRTPPYRRSQIPTAAAVVSAPAVSGSPTPTPPADVSFIADRSILPSDRPAGIAVHLRGTGTNWRQGSTSFTLSGVTPLPTILATIVNGTAAATLVIATGDTGTSPQTLTIADNAGASIANTLQVRPHRAPKYFPGLFSR